MAEQGEEKLIEVARHIARTLGRTDTMADDILQIFSNFDGRFTRERLRPYRYSDGSTSSEHHTPPFSSSIDRTIRSLELQVSHFLSSDRSIWLDSAEAAAFLNAIDAITSTAHRLNLSPGDGPDRAVDLLHQCMLRLEEEFRSMIENPFGVSPFDPFPAPELDSDGEEDLIPVAPPVTDYNIFIDALPPGTLADLKEIAKRMVTAGFGRECAHAYSLSRKDFLEESLCRLGIPLQAARPYTELEDEICRWVKASNVAFRILFPSERRLCLRVFSGLSPISDFSFAEACRGPAIQLLRLADAMASESRSPEILFRVIDMYETLRDFLPEVDALFSDQYCVFIYTKTFSVWKKLGAAIRGIFTELDNLIRQDPANAEVPGGGLHPITRYVMNYLRAACSSRKTLEEVMADNRGHAAPIRSQEQPSSPFAVQIGWIMEVLQSNLEEKARVYRQPGLSCIFLMNNGRYMMQKVKDSRELTALLREDWIRGQAARERRWAAEYQKCTWGRATSVLRIDNNDPPTTKVIRERLRAANVYLEEIWLAQAGWVVVDELLRKELRAAAAGIVLPMYRQFLEVYMVVEGRKHEEKVVRHSLRDVEGHINGLFGGKADKTPA